MTNEKGAKMDEQKARLAAALADAKVRRNAQETKNGWMRRWTAVYHRELARMALDPFDLVLVGILLLASAVMFTAADAPWRPHSHDGGRTWHVHTSIGGAE